MKYPLLILIIVPVLSGCIAEKIKASGTRSGELLCNDSNCVLPLKMRYLVKCREKAYHSMNQVDYGNLHFACDLPEDCYKQILELRWELARANRVNDILVEDLKGILRRDPCEEVDLLFENPTQTTDRQEVASIIRDIHAEHAHFVEKYNCLKGLIKPYRPSFIEKFFLL